MTNDMIIQLQKIFLIILEKNTVQNLSIESFLILE